MCKAGHIGGCTRWSRLLNRAQPIEHGDDRNIWYDAPAFGAGQTRSGRRIPDRNYINVRYGPDSVPLTTSTIWGLFLSRSPAIPSRSLASCPSSTSANVTLMFAPTGVDDPSGSANNSD